MNLLPKRKHSNEKEEEFNIILDEHNHLKSIHFNDNSLDETCIKSMTTWTEISKIAIITGKNGHGKTQLLNYIQRYVNEKRLDTEIFFQDDYEVWFKERSTIDNYVNDNRFSMSDLENLMQVSLNYLQNKNEAELFQLFRRYKSNSDSKKDFRSYLIWLDSISSKPISEQKTSIRGEIHKVFTTLNSEVENKFTKFLALLKSIEKDKKSKIENFGHQRYDDSVRLLYDYYKSTYENPTYEKFCRLSMDKVESNDLITGCVNQYYKNEKEKEFYDDLKKYGFQITDPDRNHQFIIEKKNHRDNFQRITTRSTGEVFLLNLLGLKYEINNVRITKPNILMFDEPDKSWDPDYIRAFLNIIYEDFFKKNNIQIILTTHRTDTIKQASTFHDTSIGFFSITNGKLLDQKQIIQCHPLLVTFRLTKDRELVSLKTKVYVESLNDCYFYSSYYESFYNLCQRLRNNGEKKILNHRVLSRRFQLQFFSCALSKRGGGGCIAVLDAVKRDLNSIDYDACATSNFIPSKLKKPFGLIDLDFAEDPNNPSNTNKVKSEKLSDRISILERHSLENFSFDPLLLLFNHQSHIQEFIEKLPENNFTQICRECFNTSLSDFMKLSEPKIFDSFFEAVLKNAFESDLDKNKSIHQVYHFLREKASALNRFPQYMKIRSCSINELDNMLKSSEVDEIDESNRYKKLISIKKKISYAKLDENGPPEIINFDYPIVFLYLKGHTIVENFFQMLFGCFSKDETRDQKADRKQFEDKIYASRISNLNLIPVDLLNSFFLLNEWNIKQANSFLKENSIRMEIDEQEVLTNSQPTTSVDSQQIIN